VSSPGCGKTIAWPPPMRGMWTCSESHLCDLCAQMASDAPPALVMHCKHAHAGPGWYYADDNYPDEGTCGAFKTEAEAVKHATDAGYQCVTVAEPPRKGVERTQCMVCDTLDNGACSACGNAPSSAPASKIGGAS